MQTTIRISKILKQLIDDKRGAISIERYLTLLNNNELEAIALEFKGKTKYVQKRVRYSFASMELNEEITLRDVGLNTAKNHKVARAMSHVINKYGRQFNWEWLSMVDAKITRTH